MARLGVYVADGFADDCEELIHRCSKRKPLTYHTFCVIWKSMNFISIYQGRTTSAEIAELSEEVILVAKRFMLADTNNFEETVAGLFLVYALLNLQPLPNFAALRITPNDVPMILYIEDTARKEKRYDALYILGAVLIKGPCQFHAAEREYGMEVALRKNFEGVDENSSSRPKGVFMRKNEELEILEELKALTQHYEKTKAAVTNETGTVDRNLRYVEPNFAEEMESSLKRVIMGLTGGVPDEDNHEHQASADRHTFVQAIKKRALKNTVNSMGHLTGVEERAGPSTSTTQGGNKTQKRRKMKTSSGRRKNAFLRPKNKVNRNKQDTRSSESDEDDLVLPDSDDDDLSLVNSDGECLEADKQEASVEKNPKEKQNKNDNIDMNMTKVDEAIFQSEKEINIEIDTLPVLIRKSTNQNIEIEFIDNYKKDDTTPSTSKVKRKVKKDLKTKLAELRDISVIKNTPEPEKSEMDFVFKRPASGRSYYSKAQVKLNRKQGSQQENTTLDATCVKELPNINDG